MIARVAQNCFWLHRYMERAENTARLMQVNLHVALDVDLPEADLWLPVLHVGSEQRHFRRVHGAEAVGDPELVQEFMVWDEQNPASLFNSLRLARENARTIRETISLEMWQAVNTAWLWLSGGAGRRQYDRERHAFYERVKTSCQLFHGLYHTTMLLDEPYDFMRLGSLLERSDQTTRILLSMYRVAGGASRPETPGDAARWLAVLRSCSAVEPFVKGTRGVLVGREVAAFLLYDDRFPRAVMHCLSRAQVFLDRIRGGADAEPGRNSAVAVTSLLERLRTHTIEQVLEQGMADELCRLLEGTAAIGEVLREDFFEVVSPTASGEF